MSESLLITRLAAALHRYNEAAKKEWLYQTGQTVRPAQQYPPPGTVCGELFDAGEGVKELLKEAKNYCIPH